MHEQNLRRVDHNSLMFFIEFQSDLAAPQRRPHDDANGHQPVAPFDSADPTKLARSFLVQDVDVAIL